MRRAGGWLALIAAATAAGCSPPATPDGGPAVPALRAGALAGNNVLLVTIDTLRRDRVGAYGHRGGLTPALDRLSAAGVRFTRAFTHAPQTLPAHASILTGLTPVGHGLHLNGAARLGDGVPTLATVLKQSGYRTGAFVGAFVLDARFGLARGFDEYDDRMPSAGNGTTFGYAERTGADVAQAAGDWIVGAPASDRWLAWVHLFDPHVPYQAPAEFGAGRTPYDGEVAYADAMLGRLLDRLGAAGRLDRTLVVVTADHGESLGDHGETTHGLFAYDATLAVPLIMSGRGVGRGVFADPVGHADILPTVLELLAVGPPPLLQGRSLLKPAADDQAVYFEALDAHLTRDWAPLSGVATRQWKYIHLPEAELYAPDDQAELRNLAAQEVAASNRLERIRSALAAAPTRDAPAAAAVDSSAERRLRSLGYASGVAGAVRPGRVYGAADDPKHLVALNERFNSALEMFNAGLADEALAALLALVRERADFMTARTGAATVLLARGRAREAVALLRDVPPPLADAPDVLAKLGVALREAGELPAAATALERARRAGYGNPELLNDLGVVYARLGRAAEARASFRALLDHDPDSASAWNNLGVLELTLARAAPAADAFRKAVAADPARADAWQGLGAALIDSDRPAAIEAWRRAERMRPDDYDLLFNLGMVLADGPRPADAQPYLTRFLHEAPPSRYGADRARVAAMLRRVTP